MKVPQLKKKLEIKTCHNVDWEDNYSWIHQNNILEVLKEQLTLTVTNILNLLKENIHDQKTNTTRFLVIGNEFPDKTQNDKTSISLSLKNEQGALLKVLQIVNKNKINLTNILSRPVKKNKWQYSFFLEFSGHASDKNVEKLFKELQKVSQDFKVLGSYPAAY